MISSYRIESEQLEPCERGAASVLVYSQPTDAEKEELLHQWSLDPLDMEAINDADEVPRVESIPGGLLIIWKRPDNASGTYAVQFAVSSLGFVLKDGKAIMIAPRGELLLTGREFKRITTVEDCLFRVLLHTLHHYQGHLKAVKMMSQELQAKIETSMENKYLLQMFALGESLIYYHNALEANLTVLNKLRSYSEKLKLTTEQVNLLDEVIIENQQAGKQAGIYSTVLSGLMDARGTIVNNNMNVLLKKLTIINVVFLPLNLIASIGGMSEFSVMTHGIHWPVSYGLFSLAMLTLGWLTWFWLAKVMGR